MRFVAALDTFLWLLSMVFTIYIAYYLFFLPLSLRRHSPAPKHAPKCRFAVLIAARNEQAVIGHLVESLAAQDYPAELYDIFVIPNNCTDDTAAVARAHGAKLLHCSLPVRCKGDVLREVIAKLDKQGAHDAICVFDADNVVDPGFLRAMNNAWCAGARAAQGYRDSKNPRDTMISGSYSIYYWMVNRFYSHARAESGLSAIINGSGFMADFSLLSAMGGWNTQTLTEDIEFTTKCILAGERVHWVPEALTYDEQPLTFAQSWRQRCRWSTGLYQCLAHYFLPLMRGLFAGGLQGFRAHTDQLLFLLAPVIQLFWLMSMAGDQFMRMLQMHYRLFPSNQLFSGLFLSLAVSYLISTAMAAFVTLLEGKTRTPMMRSILGYWLFIMSWVPINVYCLFRRTTEWKAIAHTRSVALSQIRD